MERVIHNAGEIDAANRQAIERLIGKHLAEHQQIIISVVDPPRPGEPAAPESGAVPAWRNIYEGLSDADIDRLDHAVRQRANLTAPEPEELEVDETEGDSTFEEDLDYVLDKNAELYRRLAR